MAQDSSPRIRIRVAARRYGERSLVLRCLDLLAGSIPDVELLDILGGTSAVGVMAGREGGTQGHWPRVWAVRALLYVWDPSAEPAVIAAGRDEHWRVREMAAKALRARQTTSTESEKLLELLVTDSNDRVRAAAERALR